LAAALLFALEAFLGLGSEVHAKEQPKELVLAVGCDNSGGDCLPAVWGSTGIPSSRAPCPRATTP